MIRAIRSTQEECETVYSTDYDGGTDVSDKHEMEDDDEKEDVKQKIS